MELTLIHVMCLEWFGLFSLAPSPHLVMATESKTMNVDVVAPVEEQDVQIDPEVQMRRGTTLFLFF